MTFIAATIIDNNLQRIDIAQLCPDILFHPRRLPITERREKARSSGDELDVRKFGTDSLEMSIYSDSAK